MFYIIQDNMNKIGQFIKKLRKEKGLTQSQLAEKLNTMPVGPPKMSGSWWRGLTECGPLEKGMANHFSIIPRESHEQY